MSWRAIKNVHTGSLDVRVHVNWGFSRTSDHRNSDMKMNLTFQLVAYCISEF
jgi:hypothetical protein